MKIVFGLSLCVLLAGISYKWKKAEKKEETIYFFWLCICFFAVLFCFYSIFTHGQTIIHSDSATAELLVQSQMKNQSFFPITWNYANGELWVFHINIWELLTSFFCTDKVLARVAASACNLLFASVGIIALSKWGFRDYSWTISIPLITVFLCGSSDMILYQSAYTIQIMWLSICPLCLMYLLTEESNNKIRLISLLLGIVLFLISLIGSRMLAEETIPLIVATALMPIWQSIKTSGKQQPNTNDKYLKVIILIILFSMLGLYVHNKISITHNMNLSDKSDMVFADNLSLLFSNILIVITNYFKCFGYKGNVSLLSYYGIRNLLSIFVCFLVCFLIPYFQFKNIKKENKKIIIFCIFVVIHNLAMATICILFSKIYERYLLTSVLCSIILSARFIVHRIKQYPSFFALGFSFIFAIAVFFQCYGLYLDSIGWRFQLNERKAINCQLMENGLSKGYASYWNAYTNELYSNLNIRYGGITIRENGIYPYRWLVDDSVFIDSNGPTFLLLTKEEYEIIESKIENLLGDPIDVFYPEGYVIRFSDSKGDIMYTSKDKKLIVLVYNYDIIQKFGAFE